MTMFKGIYLVLFTIAFVWLLRKKKGRINGKLVVVMTLLFIVETIVRIYIFLTERTL
jgi:hypothetical protein